MRAPQLVDDGRVPKDAPLAHPAQGHLAPLCSTQPLNIAPPEPVQTDGEEG